MRLGARQLRPLKVYKDPVRYQSAPGHCLTDMAPLVRQVVQGGTAGVRGSHNVGSYIVVCYSLCPLTQCDA